VPNDTIATIDRMETPVKQVRVRNMRKADLMKGLFDEYVDVEKIIKALST
jgi:BioD-like phosphotransacetylase family protein